MDDALSMRAIADLLVSLDLLSLLSAAASMSLMRLFVGIFWGIVRVVEVREEFVVERLPVMLERARSVLRRSEDRGG